MDKPNMKRTSTVTLKEISLHDSKILDIFELNNDLYIKVDMINVIELTEANPTNIARQTSMGYVVFRHGDIEKCEKNFPTRAKQSPIPNEIINDITYESIKNMIKIGDSYIYGIEYNDNTINNLVLYVDSLNNYILWVFISFKKIEIMWDEFVCDSWWVKREKKIKQKKKDDERINELFTRLEEIYNEIKSLDNSKYSIEINKDLVILILHNHLKITFVFDNHPEEAVIYFDRRISQYTHWHIDNYEAITFLKDLILDKIVFIESKVLRFLGLQCAYKIVSVDKYNQIKKRYLGNKFKNIFTANQIVQGKLKNIFKA